MEYLPHLQHIRTQDAMLDNNTHNRVFLDHLSPSLVLRSNPLFSCYPLYR